MSLAAGPRPSPVAGDRPVASLNQAATTDVSIDPGVINPGAPDAARWRAALAALAVGELALFALFWPAAAKAVEVWSTTSAYNHLFLIAPISLYVIWERRRWLVGLAPAPAPGVLAALPLFALPWLAANAAGISEIQQFALLGMAELMVLAVLGWPVCRALAFPLLYLWLLVPTGEFLLAGLQDLTAAVATRGLELAGLPVYTEGILIETPSGRYRVEPGCAGLNFLLAALAFALLFANLIYRGWRKRAVAVALALAIAIGANWLRVWGIILIDHLTGKQTDIVDDHLVYGWAFFAVVMMAAMALGLRWRDDGRPPATAGPRPPGPRPPGARAPAAVPKPGGTGLAGFAAVAGLALALAALAPAYAHFVGAPKIAPEILRRLLDDRAAAGCPAPGAISGTNTETNMEDGRCAD